jgi:hypothetical protein
MSVELWKEIFDWLAVILVGLTFVAGAGALLTGKILSDRQSVQSRQFETDLTAAKDELSKQQERAAKAEKALIELQDQRRPRFTAEQRRQLLGDLKANPKGEVEIIAAMSDSGAIALAADVRTILAEAGWKIAGHGVSPISTNAYHMVLQVRDATRPSPRSLHLRNALRAVGIKITGESQPTMGRDALVLVVGSKP